MKIKEFWKPQFTTAQFESAKTKTGQTPKFTKMKMGQVIGQPFKVFGKVDIDGKNTNVTWNRWGECSVYYPNTRYPKGDLVHPDSAEIGSAQEYFVAMAIFIAMLAIAGLF